MGNVSEFPIMSEDGRVTIPTFAANPTAAPIIPDDADELTGRTCEEILLAGHEDYAALNDDDSFMTKRKQPQAEICPAWDILEQLASGEILLPACQRQYVWTKKDRDKFEETVQRRLGCGCITVAECTDGKRYLVDGYQRMTSLRMMIDKLDGADKVAVTNYNIIVAVVKQITPSEVIDQFNLINNGVAIASVTKERTQLPEEVNVAVTKVSHNAFLENVENVTAKYQSGSHGELIAMNALLAVAGCEPGDNKSKSLCARVKDAFKPENMTIATKYIDAIGQAFDVLSPAVYKRAKSANYICSLLYALVKRKHSVEDIVKLTNFVFEKRHAPSEYSRTTRTGSADKTQVTARMELLKTWLDTRAWSEPNPRQYALFVRDLEEKGVISGRMDNDLQVHYSKLTDSDLLRLYYASEDGDARLWDEVLGARTRGANSGIQEAN